MATLKSDPETVRPSPSPSSRPGWRRPFSQLLHPWHGGILTTDRSVALLLSAVAMVPRFWNLTHLGLTHFDEGSYAMTGKWVATLGSSGWIYQSGHAPGLFPTIVGLFFILFGVRDYVAIAVSALAGAGTVGMVYLAGKDWFDTRTGLSAALFLATAEYHVIYSRLALTDSLFTLLFWSAIACFYRGFRHNERRMVLLGGVLTGLCWNTKYHGFLTLLLVIPWISLEYSGRRRAALASGFRRPYHDLGSAALLALLVYLPWAAFVQISVGYGEILRNQLAHSFARPGWIITSPRTVFFYLSHWLSPPLLVSGLAGLGIAVAARNSGARLLVIVTLLFFCATLLYASFPRLILPLVPALCLLSAFGISALSSTVRPRRAALAMVTLSSLVVIWNMAEIEGVLKISTDGYRQAAVYLESTNLPVISEMSKNYYFYESRPSHEIRKESLDRLDSLVQHAPEVVIAFDPIIHRIPGAYEWVDSHRERLIPVRVFPLQLYDPVYYQGIDPTRPFEAMPRPLAPFVPGVSKIEIYRLRK